MNTRALVMPDSTDDVSGLEALNRKILSDRALRFSQSDEDLTAVHTEEMIIFRLGASSYAVPLRMLTELRTLHKLTALPQVSSAIIGVINVRGRIVSVYRLAESHGATAESAEPHSAGAKNFVLIGHGSASSIALLADDITGTRMVSPDDIRQKPISLNERDYIIGLGSDGLVFIDLEKFVSTERHYMA